MYIHIYIYIYIYIAGVTGDQRLRLSRRLPATLEENGSICDCQT